MDRLKGLYDRLQKKRSENSLSLSNSYDRINRSRSSSNDYDYFNDKLTSLSISQLNSSTKKKKKKKMVSPEVFDNLYKTKTVSAIHNSVNTNANVSNNNVSTSNNSNTNSKSNKKSIMVKKTVNKGSIKINNRNINETDNTNEDTNNDKDNNNSNKRLNGIKCLECNRPYDINNNHSNSDNSMRMKEIISSINEWKSSATFYTVCLTTSVHELLTKVKEARSLTVTDNYNIDNISNLCAIMNNVMNQNITHCYKKDIEDIVKKDFSLDNYHHHYHQDNNKVRKENVIDRFLDFAILTSSAESVVQRFFRLFLEVQKIIQFDGKSDASDDTTTTSMDLKNRSSPQTNHTQLMQRNKEELCNIIKNIKHDRIGSNDRIGKKCWIVACIILNLIDDNKCSLEQVNNIFIRCAVSTIGEAQTQGHLNYHSFTTAICALALMKYNDNTSNSYGLSNDSDRINTMATATSEIIDLENNFDKLVQLVRCYRQLADEGVFIHLSIHQSSLFKMYQKSKSMYHNKKEIKSSYGAVPKSDKKVVKINAFEYFCLAHNIIPSLCDSVLVLRISQYVKSLTAKRDLLYFMGCLGYLIFSVARDMNDPFGSVSEDHISSTTSKVIYMIIDSKNAHYNV